jgi:hypothetical protein
LFCNFLLFLKVLQHIPFFLRSWGAPRLHFFISFLLTPHFYWAIQACMKQSTPVPKS